MNDRRLSAEDLRFDPPSLDAGTAREMMADRFGLVGEIVALRGERDQNWLIDTGGGRFVGKLSSPSEDRDVLDLQCRALRHLEEVAPDLPVPRVVPAVDGEVLVEWRDRGVGYGVRVLSYLDGVTFDDATALSPSGLRGIGRIQGMMTAALADFAHPAASHFMPWALDRGLVVHDGLWDGLGADARDVLAPVRERMQRLVDGTAGLPIQVVHHDAHRGNLLRADASVEEVVGIIDFGDLVGTARIADLAVSGASFACGAPDPVEALASLVAGFDQVCPLEPAEVAWLPELLLGRLVLSMLIIDYQVRHSPHIAAAVTRERPGILDDTRRWLEIDAVAAADRLQHAIGARS